MKSRIRMALLTAAAFLMGSSAFADVVFLSTQLRPIEQAQVVRGELLNGLEQRVEFIAQEPAPFAVRLEAERQAGKFTVSLVGGLHGELSPLAAKGALMPLDDLAAKLSGLGMPKALLDLGKLGGEKQQYIPWMQATYVMAANKKALPYLPAGADINALTYEQLIQWGQNMKAQTGQARIGFPAGPKGLMVRFFQGYFYPSFTGGVVRTFKSADAIKGWEAFKNLWDVVNPNSSNYDFMQEPLQGEEVWVAWDHIARLQQALSAAPNQYVVFAPPAGPKGRGYAPVLAGLAIPVGAPDVAGAYATIEKLLKPETQVVTAAKLGFFPVVSVKMPADLDPSVALLSAAVDATQRAPDALTALLPVGLGDRGGEFNKIYIDTFTRIALRGEAIPEVLKEQSVTLAKLMQDTAAACWAPDAASKGPCPVE